MAIKYDSSDRQINATLELLKSWDCLKHLTKNEKERIKFELQLIKTSAVHDIKNSINQIEL